MENYLLYLGLILLGFGAYINYKSIPFFMVGDNVLGASQIIRFKNLQRAYGSERDEKKKAKLMLYMKLRIRSYIILASGILLIILFFVLE